MNITNINITDLPNGNKFYTCKWGILKASYETDGIRLKHLNKQEFEAMVVQAYKDSKTIDCEQ